MPPPSAASELPAWSPPAGQRGEARPHWFRRFFGFVGPGYLVAVGYMDPGNWATSVAAGSAHGYSLLWIVALSSVMAAFLQVLCARLGIVTGMDLAQLSRAQSSRASGLAQWLACEVAICACDLAEVIGTAIALKLLFGIPMHWGVLLTLFVVLSVLWLQQRGLRHLEAMVVSLLGLILLCFVATLALAQPVWGDVLAGFVPDRSIAVTPGMLYLAMGIVGATVMPHNLYLHSSMVKTRQHEIDAAGKRSALRFATADVVLALGLAFFVNAAILVTASSVFHTSGHHEVAQLEDAYRLLGPLTGTTLASVLFAVALLASGQSSAVTATLAGQVVMEGFLKFRMAPVARCLLTRSVAIVPALVVTLTCGEAATGKLLLASQIVLSLQLPLAVAPLVRFTGSRKLMGEFANSRWMAWLARTVVVAIVGLNLLLVWQAIAG